MRLEDVQRRVSKRESQARDPVPIYGHGRYVPARNRQLSSGCSQPRRKRVQTKVRVRSVFWRGIIH